MRTEEAFIVNILCFARVKRDTHLGEFVKRGLRMINMIIE